MRSGPLFLLGSDVTGDGSARFVVFIPSIFLHVWRDWGGVICLGGSNDVPDELTIGGVRLEKTYSGYFATGSAKPPGRVSLPLGLPSNRFPL